MRISRIFKFREGEQGEAVKPFLDHLEDLRWVIVKMAVALGAAMLLAFCFRTQLVHILQGPLKCDRSKVAEIPCFFGCGRLDDDLLPACLLRRDRSLVSVPDLLCRAIRPPRSDTAGKEGYASGCWNRLRAFPGRRRPRILPRLAGDSSIFFRDAQSLDWTPTWTVRDYFSFVTQLCVGFGAAFELPVIVLVLVRLRCFVGVLFYAAPGPTRSC